MSRLLNKATVILLVLVLVGTLGLSCGGGDEGGKVTITTGEINDLTGYASAWLIPMHYGLVDLVRYYNDEGLIPGVELKVVSYDDQMNPAKTIPGYDWVRSKGAHLAIVNLPQDGEVLKPFADRDKFPVFSGSSTKAMQEPPGWVFPISARCDQMMVTLLKWVSENRWDYSQGIPKVGFVGWSETNTISIEKATKEYCQAYPNKFDYIGGFLPPIGTSLWSAEVQKLNNCDYIGTAGSPAPGFIRAYEGRGYRATILDPSTLLTGQGYTLDMVGWEGIDGMLSVTSTLVWSDTEPIVDLARETLERYRHGEAAKMIRTGSGYLSAVVSYAAMLGILQSAIEALGGAENLSSQAIYNAAIEYKTEGPLWQGIPQWGYSQTKRYFCDHVRIYKWSAPEEDIVRVQDWIPLVIEW
jgi:ABC-type branched-subunit amino acid transport system substrate-binding protein